MNLPEGWTYTEYNGRVHIKDAKENKMINTNKLMKMALGKQDYCMVQHNLPEKIVAQTKLIKDCIIYDEDGQLIESDVDFDRVIKMFGDKTGYKVACNEVRIEKDTLNISQIITFLSDISIEFEKKYSRKMVLYIQDLECCYELRFHTLGKMKDYGCQMT